MPTKITPRREFHEHAWRHPLALLGFLLLLWFLFELRALVVAVLFALTLASAIAPVAEWWEERYKVPRVASVLVVYILVGLIYSMVAFSLYPTISEQAHRLYNQLPQYTSGLTDLYGRVKTLLGENAGAFNVTTDEVKGFMSRASKQALHFTHDLLTLIVSGILVLFLTAYFVIEAKAIWPKLLRWFPRARRERIGQVIKPLETRLGGYVRGQILVSIAVGTFLAAGLSLLRVEHSLVLGVLAGLLNLVPFVGSMVTAVLAILVAFNQSILLAGLTVLLFAVEQWFESNFIVPHLLGGQVELHPLMVLFAILVGASLMGLPGALIAVPLTSAIAYLAEEFYLKPMAEAEARQDILEVAGGNGHTPSIGQESDKDSVNLSVAADGEDHSIKVAETSEESELS